MAAKTGSLSLKSAGVAGGALFLTAFPMAGAQSQNWNMYQGNTSLTLSYLDGSLNSRNADGTFSNTAARVNIAVNGSSPIGVTLDTGSTGIALSKSFFSQDYLNTLTPLGNGAYNYDSSGNTPTGTFYQIPVSLLGKVNGQAATGTTTVKVLVVTNDAPGTRTAYMGVGNNRNNIFSGTYNPALSFNENVSRGIITPISAAGFNPLINVSVNGTALPNQGYVVANNQLSVGLTAANNSYSFVKLVADPAAGPNLWNGIPVALSVAGGAYGVGTILHDTGIDNAYLKPGATTGDTVSISMPGAPPQGAFYSFIVRATSPVTSCGGAGYTALTPCAVMGSPSPTPFLNTGRQFYAGFNYLFDPVNGFAGYALSDSGLTAGATVTPLLALQNNVSLPGGFSSTLPVALFAPTTLSTPTGGVASFQSSFTGLGNNLALTGGGTFAFNGSADLGGGNLSVQQGTAAINAGFAANQVSVAQQGTLVNASGSTVSGAIANAGTIVNSGNINGLIANSGLMSNSGTVNGSVANSGSFINSGTIVGNVANTASLTNTATISGSVANNGTVVNNGTVTGNFQNNGLLSGGGLIGGNLVQGGTVSPGNSIGTLSVGGNYTHLNGSQYVVEVTPKSSDRIAAGGTATLQGGTVAVVPQTTSGFAASTTYAIVSAAGGLSGQFSSVSDPYPFLLPSLSYDANNAYLTLQVGGFAAAAATPTQAAVGAVLDANVGNATGDFATVLNALAFNTLTSSQAQYALQSLSGNNYAGFSSSMVQGAALFMNNFAGTAGGQGAPRVALAEACEVACDATTRPSWGAWGGALGGLGSIGAGAAVGAVTYNAGGFAAGLDRAVSDSVRLGVTTGYTAGNQWVSGFAGQGRTDTFQVGLYGNWAQGPAYADGLLGYAYSWNQMWRPILLPGLGSRTALGQTGANQWFGQVEGGYRFELGTTAAAWVTPFARLQAYTGTQNGFTETGASSLNLTVAQQTTNSLRSVLGATLGGSFDLGWREKLALQFRLGWSHEYADTSRPVSATLAGAPAMPFTTFGISPTRDGALLGFGANTAIADATSVYLRYEGTIAGQDSTHALTAGLRMTW